MTIQSRQQLIDYALRALGDPVIEIAQNLDFSQIEDRLDEALQLFREWHMDGSEKTYLKHTVTQDDIDGKFVRMPDGVLSVVKIFNPQGQYGIGGGIGSLAGMQWQMALSDMLDLSGNTQMTYYTQIRSHLTLIEQTLIGMKPLRFNMSSHRCYIDMDWTVVGVGDVLVFETFAAIDPSDFMDVFNNQWLKDYFTALVKLQLGTNLKKYNGVLLPGGISLNGQQIYDESIIEIGQVKEELTRKFATPALFWVG